MGSFYIESADRPRKSRPAGSDVDIGEYVAENGSDEVAPFDGSSDAVGDLAGVADNPRSGDWIVREEDDTDDGTYKSSENDRVVYGGDADRDVIKVRTAEDTGGNEPTPDIEDGDLVGFIDTGNHSISSASEYHGRVVEDGYADGDGNTFDNSASDFVPLGEAYKDAVNAYDEPVRVEVRRDL